MNAHNKESHSLLERTFKFFFNLWVLLFAVAFVHAKLREFAIWKDDLDQNIISLIFIYSYLLTVTIMYFFEIASDLIKELACEGKQNQTLYIAEILICTIFLLDSGVTHAGTLNPIYDQSLSPKVFFAVVIIDLFFLDFIPVILSICYSKNKFSVRIFRQRGFYVGPYLLQSHNFGSEYTKNLSTKNDIRNFRKYMQGDEEDESILGPNP